MRHLGPALLLACALPAAADTAEHDYFAVPLEQLLNVELEPKAAIGSRGAPRGVTQAEVPIDIITASQLESAGQPELARALASLLPGFNHPRPSVTDGTDHSPPFTLRGLNPDQVLVLVNGKRLHQSALLHFNGTIGRGSSGVDLNSIPLRAVERVEVLRDGAAAQYGSDAIAGVINIILKGYGYDSSMHTRYGRTHKGDGIVRQLELFNSVPLVGDGFINLTTELRDRGASNRAGPDPQDGNRINMKFGDPHAEDLLLGLNMEAPRGDLTLYAHGQYDRRDSLAAAFYRRADDDRNLPAIYPDGFLPKIEAQIRDLSLTLGLRGVLDSGLLWDASYTRGSNRFQINVRDSLNRSLGVDSPRNFDSGALVNTQDTLNLDFTRDLGPHRLAGGYEFRHQHYRIEAGEPASYLLGSAHNDWPGAQGFSGFQPDDEVDARRNSHAGYLDFSYAASRQLTLDSALRAEYFDDFGTTLDGKLALRYRASERLLLRSSLSSGFRAPSLSQAHFSSTAMIRNGSDILQYGIYNVDHPVARALGARDLKPEKSRHLTFGLAYQASPALSLSADYFITDINDRIMATSYISDWNPGQLSPEALAILQQQKVAGVVYFTNAVNTRTQGFDLRLDYKYDFASAGKLHLNAAFQHAETRIRSVNSAPPVLGLDMDALILDPYTRVSLTEGQPSDSLKLWGRYSHGPWDLTLNLSRYGSYASTNDEHKQTFAAQWLTDLDIGYRLTADTRIALGATNLFNQKPGRWGVTDDDRIGSDKPIRYSQHAPTGYNGAAYYLQLGVQF